MNLLTALVLLTILALVGLPKIVDNQFTVKSDTRETAHKVLVGYIDPGSPAAKAGLQPQDQLAAIGLPGQPAVDITRADKVPALTRSLAGRTVTLSYIRHGHKEQARTQLLSRSAVEASRHTDNPKGYLGIIPNDVSLQRSTWSAPIVAIGFSVQVTALTFQGVGHALGGLGSLIAGLVTGNTTAREHGATDASSQVAGPVGIFVILKDGSLLGWQYMRTIIAIVSLTLAIMNILPVPALDGGRLWLTLATRAIRRPLSARSEELINAAGFLLLISLVILITIVDVKRFF